MVTKNSQNYRAARPLLIQLTLLGSGTSTGVPIIGCKCAVCRSKHPKNQRLRASAWLRTQGKHLIIDTGPDFRAQVMRARVPRLDAVLFTHSHADHSHGIDDVRAFNFHQGESIPCFANEETSAKLAEIFPYVFTPPQNHIGGGLPRLELRPFAPVTAEIAPAGVPVIPLDLPHGHGRTTGYRIGDLAYVVDCDDVPPAAIARLGGLRTLVLDCVQRRPHKTHLYLEKSIAIAERIGAKETYFTHLGHDFDFRRKTMERLPKGIKLAYDGLTLKGSLA